MARQLRIQVPGAFYLVSNQTETKTNLFRDSEEKAIFMECLLETRSKTGWQIHAYALVKDGYYILLECPEPNLVDGMKWFQGAFTAKVNKHRGKREPLFVRRYRSVIIDPGESEIFGKIADYIHTAPIWSKSHKGSPSEYEWSSCSGYLAAKSKRDSWLTADKVLAGLGLKDDTGGRKKYGQHIADRASALGGSSIPSELATEWKPITRGWYIGGDKFLKDIRGVIDKTRQGKVPGKASPKNVHGETMARNIIKAGFKILKIKESDLAKMPLGSDEKVILAYTLRSLTTVSQDWISKRLKMGHRTNVSNGITRVKNDQDGNLLKLVRQIEKAL